MHVLVVGGNRQVGESGLVTSVTRNDRAIAALKADGSVVAWGNSTAGGDCTKIQDQLVDVQHIYSTTNAFAALKADGSVVSWGLSRKEAEALAHRQ